MALMEASISLSLILDSDKCIKRINEGIYRSFAETIDKFVDIEDTIIKGGIMKEVNTDILDKDTYTLRVMISDGQRLDRRDNS